MNRTDRRELLRWGMGLAVLPILAGRRVQAMDLLAADAAQPIAPPTRSMIYRRSVLRDLPGGARLTVTRDFQVHFSPLATGGYQLDGQQTRAQVQAPAGLTALARLEEQRVEGGIFPLTLDRLGRIVDGEATRPDSNLAAALLAMRERLAQDGPEAQEMLAALPADGHLLSAEMPHDLFAPPLDQVEQQQTVPLPWGDAGNVRVRFTATRDPATRLMRQARREVVTTLAGDERRSAEQWELYPA